MQRWQCPSYSGTLEPLISSKCVEDTVVFLTWKVFISGSFSIAFDKQVLVIRKSLNGLKKQKQCCLIHTWSDKAFKGTVVNRTLPSLHGNTLPKNRYIITCSNSSSVILENCSKFWKLFKTDILSPAVTVPLSFWKTVPSFENFSKQIYYHLQ